MISIYFMPHQLWLSEKFLDMGSNHIIWGGSISLVQGISNRWNHFSDYSLIDSFAHPFNLTGRMEMTCLKPALRKNHIPSCNRWWFWLFKKEIAQFIKKDSLVHFFYCRLIVREQKVLIITVVTLQQFISCLHVLTVC